MTWYEYNDEIKDCKNALVYSRLIAAAVALCISYSIARFVVGVKLCAAVLGDARAGVLRSANDLRSKVKRSFKVLPVGHMLISALWRKETSKDIFWFACIGQGFGCGRHGEVIHSSTNPGHRWKQRGMFILPLLLLALPCVSGTWHSRHGEANLGDFSNDHFGNPHETGDATLNGKSAHEYAVMFERQLSNYLRAPRHHRHHYEHLNDGHKAASTLLHSVIDSMLDDMAGSKSMHTKSEDDLILWKKPNDVRDVERPSSTTPASSAAGENSGGGGGGGGHPISDQNSLGQQGHDDTCSAVQSLLGHLWGHVRKANVTEGFTFMENAEATVEEMTLLQLSMVCSCS